MSASLDADRGLPDLLRCVWLPDGGTRRPSTNADRHIHERATAQRLIGRRAAGRWASFLTKPSRSNISDAASDLSGPRRRQLAFARCQRGRIPASQLSVATPPYL